MKFPIKHALTETRLRTCSSVWQTVYTSPRLCLFPSF